MSKHAEWERWLKPNVVQVQKVADGYRVKTASYRYWDPRTELVNRGDVVHDYGAQVALDADLTGCCTLASGLAKTADEAALTETKTAINPGAYKVRDTSGQEHIGYAIPMLTTMEGSEIPLGLFTNGSVVAVQSEIHGCPAGDITLPSSPISKHGAFYTVRGAGIRMTVPLTLESSVSFSDQPTRTYHGTTFDGSPIQVSVQGNITDLTPVSDSSVLIPEDWKWLPLDHATEIQLADGDVSDSLNPEEKLSHVRIVSDGMSFSFSGVPLTKIANDQKSFLNLDEAMFLLAGLGVDLEYGTQKLAEAAALHQPSFVKVARIIERKEDLFQQAFEKAAGVMNAVAGFKQPILIKEAASFPILRLWTLSSVSDSSTLRTL